MVPCRKISRWNIIQLSWNAYRVRHLNLSQRWRAVYREGYASATPSTRRTTTLSRTNMFIWRKTMRRCKKKLLSNLRFLLVDQTPHQHHQQLSYLLKVDTYVIASFHAASEKSEKGLPTGLQDISGDPQQTFDLQGYEMRWSCSKNHFWYTWIFNEIRAALEGNISTEVWVMKKLQRVDWDFLCVLAI